MNSDHTESIEEIIVEILSRARSVAVVGLSDDPFRPSYGVAQELQARGYRVIGVNPTVSEVPGFTCFARLSEIPDPVDLVDVFRRSDALDPIVDEVIALKILYLWFQEGVVNQAVADRARQAGIKVVMDRCIAKELNKRQM